MAFLSTIGQAIESNPGLIASALQLFTGSLGNSAGTAGNAAMNALNAQSEMFQTGMYAQELMHDERMQVISQSFDEMMDERSEHLCTVAETLAVLLAIRRAAARKA